MYLKKKVLNAISTLTEKLFRRQYSDPQMTVPSVSHNWRTK